jgi:hypothetical protein
VHNDLRTDASGSSPNRASSHCFASHAEQGVVQLERSCFVCVSTGITAPKINGSRREDARGSEKDMGTRATKAGTGMACSNDGHGGVRCNRKRLD